MNDRIKEEAIATIEMDELRQYTDFFVAASGGFEVGDAVFRVREIQRGGGQTPSLSPMAGRRLVIEVADSEAEDTRDRVRTAITARMFERR
ncbi:hypothetical protein [Variovorax paradoxus]|jgi:hypothetical protein|uniref:hypothetical protein n=1 Tax=Variovorax paradoxus TaxID=34073 RepID=UPI0033918F16